MPDNVQSMFSVAKVPWHKKGIVLANPPTSDQAIKLAGMDWEVTRNETFYSLEDGTKLGKIPNRFAMVRSDNQVVVGNVGKNFEVLQNKDAFWFFDSFVQEGLAAYETAGVLGIGETIWVLAKFNGAVNIGRDDEVREYMLLANGHDGSTNVLVQPTDVRVVCQNTLMASLGMGNVVRIRHCRSMKDNLQSIKDQILRLHEGRRYVHEAYQLMAETQVQETDKAAFFRSLWPEPDYSEIGKTQETVAHQYWRARMSGIDYLLEHGKGTEKTWLKGTVWWLYNSVTEAVDWYLGNSNRVKDKTSYVLRGDGGKLKDLAFAKCVNMVNDIRGTMAIFPEKVGIIDK